MPPAATGPVRPEFNGGGLAAFQKFSLPNANTSKPFIYNALRASDCRSPRPAAGNVFLHIFPKQRTDVGLIPTAISNAVNI
jgi:hypothetical protein